MKDVLRDWNWKVIAIATALSGLGFVALVRGLVAVAVVAEQSTTEAQYDPASYKDGYQWGQQVYFGGHSTDGARSTFPSFIIPGLARSYQRSFCPKDDPEAFVAGFRRALDDLRAVQPSL